MANRFEREQTDILELAFQESDHLTKEKKIDLVNATGLDVEQISSWFNRRRSKKRSVESRDDLERANVHLRQALRESKEKESQLQKELQESKERETDLRLEIQQLKQQLGVIDGDSRIQQASRVGYCGQQQ